MSDKHSYLLRVQEKIKESSTQLCEGLIGKRKQLFFYLLSMITLFTSSPSLFKLLKSV